MPWEVLATTPAAIVRRRGRFIVAELLTPHLTLTTSARNGGQAAHVRFLVNHQSCEGSGHEARAHLVFANGPEAYHDAVSAEIERPAAETAIMGTAANMNYAALAVERDDDVEVLAVVTAGVQANATCAGDPANWRETRDGIAKVPPVAGTINTMLLVNVPVTPAALARTVVTMTEAKSAALQRLVIPSGASPDLATGTGTDQFAVAAPIDGDRPITSASTHMKFGEIVGLAVRKATLEALRWQNGLEPSYTRSLFHALGRYGIKEDAIFDDLAGMLEPASLQLLRRNSKSAFFEPMVGASAHALAAVMDRVRHQTLPASVVADAIVQQAASLAVALSANPDRWPEFRAALHARGSADLKTIVLSAIAIGWAAKWE
jgi:adenosylcobinamide amidohydrolase